MFRTTCTNCNISLFLLIFFLVSEFKPMPLSATEARLVGGITDLLANEPFEVNHSVLLHGFTACVVVKLKEGESVLQCNGSDD